MVCSTMVSVLRPVVLIGCLVLFVNCQIVLEDDVDGERYDEFIHIEAPLSEEARSALAGLVVGGARAAAAKSILQSGLVGAGLGAELGDGVESLCPNHTELILQSLLGGEQWAAQMIDAIGRQPSALLYDGNLRWLGSWEECLGVEPVAYEDPDNRTGPYKPFEPRYCQAKFTFKQMTISKAVTVGMCFPSTCSPTEDKALATTLVPFLQLPEGTSLKIKSVTCQETDRELSDKAIAVIVVCSLFITLMVMATVYDLVIVLVFNKPAARQEYKKGIPNPLYVSTDVDRVEKGRVATSDMSSGSSGSSETKLLLPGGNMSPEATKANAMSYHSVDTKVAPVEVAEIKVEKYKPGILGRLLLSFSVYTNGSKILDTSQAAGTLTAVNGIRFLSMSWVILGHTLSFKGQAPDNYQTWIAKMIARWPFQAIANATVSVDTFFVLSGLLVAYLSLKEMKRNGGPRRFNWFLYYFHRYWRLTPPYMLVMMVYVPLLGYWADGPIWNPNGIEKNECNETWWHNLLYINNLIEHKNKPQCMGWSWYLANDMQFYWLSPLMLVPLYYSKIAGSVVCGALILTNLICTGVISKHYNFYAVQKLDPPRALDGANRSEMIYVKPYTRIGTYVVGIFVGYILYRTNCKVRMRRIWVLLGWAVAATIGLLVVYGPFTSDGMYAMSEEESAFFNAAHRIGWGMAVAWVIFACATGYGGPVNTLLSWRGIIPLSRLTYCAYLVHPVVMKTYYNSVRALQHWYDLEFVYQFLANLIWSMATAFVVSLAFEAPMMGLEKVLLAKYKK